MANNQLAVLSALDLAKTQWYHFTAIIIAGMGFFTDAYDLFCISTVTNLLGRIYYLDPKSNCPCTLPSPGTLPSPSPGTLPSPSTLPPHILAAVNGVALCGAIAGQLFIGWLGDKMGRRKVYGITLMIMVIAAIASGLSFGRTAKSVMTMLCFFRFWLGFGVGGDYPLSATIMSEYANKRTRGSFIAAVFAMQGFGILAGGAVAIIVSAGFKTKYKDDSRGCTAPQADFVWRIILMFGAIPAALTYYWRMKMPETARYTALIARDANQAAADMSSVLNLEINEDQRRVEEIARTEPRFGLFSREFARRHGLRLLGTTSTWFLIDIVFYSQNLFFKNLFFKNLFFRNDIFTHLGWVPQANDMNAIEEVYQIAKAQSIVALCSTVPGYWFTVAFIERMGRKPIQLMGFFFTTLLLIALAITYHHWVEQRKPTAFIVLYCFTFFFSNFGPNVTTIIVPAEIFPARLRSTCHGISGAAGKAGAIIGTVGLIYAAEPKGISLKNYLILLAVTSATGFLFTFLIPETMGKSLEELSGENDEEQVVQLGPSRLSSRGSSRSTIPIE